MSEGRVVADPESIRRIASALAEYQRDIIDAGKSVEGALKDAEWNDHRRDEFEEGYLDFKRKVEVFVESEVQEMAKGLNLLAAQLEEILDRGM